MYVYVCKSLYMYVYVCMRMYLYVICIEMYVHACNMYIKVIPKLDVPKFVDVFFREPRGFEI